MDVALTKMFQGAGRISGLTVRMYKKRTAGWRSYDVDASNAGESFRSLHWFLLFSIWRSSNEPYLPAPGIWSHELTDSFKHLLDGGVVFLVLFLQNVNFRRKVFVGCQQFAQSDKCAHDRDVDVNGAFAPQNAGSIATPCSVKT